MSRTREMIGDILGTPLEGHSCNQKVVGRIIHGQRGLDGERGTRAEERRQRRLEKTHAKLAEDILDRVAMRAVKRFKDGDFPLPGETAFLRIHGRPTSLLKEAIR